MAKFFVPLVAPPPMNNGGGGGSDLPAVSAADNGDVLTVVNGAWDKAAPGGGGGGSSVLAVTDTEGTLNKTWQEIYNAFNAGTAVIIKSVGDGYDYGDLILCVYYEGNEFGVKLKSADYYADSATDYPVIGR